MRCASRCTAGTGTEHKASLTGAEGSTVARPSPAEASKGARTMRIRAGRPGILGGLVLGLALLLAVTQASAATHAPVCATFNPRSFHHPTRIDNPYFPR